MPWDAVQCFGLHNPSMSLPIGGFVSPFPPELSTKIHRPVLGQLHGPGDALKLCMPGAKIKANELLEISLCCKWSRGEYQQRVNRKSHPPVPAAATSKATRSSLRAKLESDALTTLKEKKSYSQTESNQSCKHILGQPRACAAKASYPQNIRSH